MVLIKGHKRSHHLHAVSAFSSAEMSFDQHLVMTLVALLSSAGDQNQFQLLPPHACLGIAFVFFSVTGAHNVNKGTVDREENQQKVMMTKRLQQQQQNEVISC